MTTFASETAGIPTTQESFHVIVTTEDNAHHFLQYQGYCSLLIYSTRPSNQPALLSGNIEANT
jgi:hypothetical protein